MEKGKISCQVKTSFKDLLSVQKNPTQAIYGSSAIYKAESQATHHNGKIDPEYLCDYKPKAASSQKQPW